MRWYWWVFWAAVFLWVIHHPVMAGHDVHGVGTHVGTSVNTFLNGLGQK